MPAHLHASLQLLFMQVHLGCLRGTPQWLGQGSVSPRNNGPTLLEACRDRQRACTEACRVYGVQAKGALTEAEVVCAASRRASCTRALALTGTQASATSTLRVTSTLHMLRTW